MNSGAQLTVRYRSCRGSVTGGLLGTKELKERGLYFWPDDVVDLESFRYMHQVELPDGRRFRSEDCALTGLDHQAAALARAFWRAKGE